MGNRVRYPGSVCFAGFQEEKEHQEVFLPLLLLEVFLPLLLLLMLLLLLRLLLPQRICEQSK